MVSNIIWFRKGLRLHDNRALLEAIRGAENLIPIVVLDPNLLDTCGARPLQFFLECLVDLDKSLRRLDSRLVVLFGDPVETVPAFAREWKVKSVFFELDTGRYGAQRDQKVMTVLETLQIKANQYSGHTLYDSREVRKIFGDTYPKQFESFQKAVSGLFIGDPLPAPDSLPPVPAGIEDVSVPSLKELGFNDELCQIDLIGGESYGLQRMQSALSDRQWVKKFQKPETSPILSPASTTQLSPYLARGCLSPRLLYKRIDHDGALVQTTLRGQLIWREFYYAASYLTPNYYEIEGNPICRKIPWDRNEQKLNAWAESKTGYPWIDAIMTQLRTEGWIHHLARHSVACFLTRGDLWVDWRMGRDVFDRFLLDTDSALNNGNWMWLSASAYFYQYFRVYGPVSFPKKYPGHAAYVKKYVPVLKNMPDKFVLEPWKAPRSVQLAAKCVVGSDYPNRIVIHEIESKELISRIAVAYKAFKE